MLTLRAPEPTDIDRLLQWENDPGLYESLPQAAPLSRYQIWQYIENYRADPFATHELRLIAADTDSSTPVGHVDLFEFSPSDRRAGVAIYIDKAYRRRGYAIHALQSVEQYAVTSLGMHQLWAIIAIDNAPSVALFTKAGYKSAGRLRSWLRRHDKYADALFFQKLFP